DRIGHLLRTSPHPSLVLIEGDAGIGKTTLWHCGVEQAGRLGIRVLSFRPGEAECALTFAGLAGILPDPVLDEIVGAIPAPRAAALGTALLRGGPPGAAAGARTLGPGGAPPPSPPPRAGPAV